jgi:hypothetical protein
MIHPKSPLFMISIKLAQIPIHQMNIPAPLTPLHIAFSGTLVCPPIVVVCERAAGREGGDDHEDVGFD